MNSRQLKKCSHCQSEISPDDAYCPECGSPVSASVQNSEAPQQASDINFCIHCGDALTADDPFCPGCGQPTTISSEVSEPAETIKPIAAPAQPPAAPASPVAPPVKIKVLHCPDCNMPLIPGSVSCTKCGKKFSKPIPKVVDDTKPQPKGKLQDPVLEGTEYHCPACKEVLKTGAVQCTGCGTSFAHPVPSYKIPLQEAERMRREDENQRREEAARVRAVEVQERAEALARAKASLGETAAQVKAVAHGSIRDAAGSPQVRQKSPLIFLFVLIAVGGGIAAIINSSRSHTNLLPADTSQSQPSGSVADLMAQGESYYEQGRYADAINSYQAAQQTTPPPDVQAELSRRISINQQMLKPSPSFTIAGKWQFVGETYCLNSDGTGYRDTMRDQTAPDGGNVKLKRTTFPLQWSIQGSRLRILMYTQAEGIDHYAINPKFIPLVVDYNYKFDSNGNLELGSVDDPLGGYTDCQPLGNADR